MSELRELYKKMSEWGKYHIVDTTALLASTNPFYSLLETCVYGMTDETSINARANIAWMSYLGLAFIYSKGRDLSKKVFKITDEARENIQKVHDALYSSAFNAILVPTLYAMSGARNLKEIVLGTLGGVALAVPTGILAGYSIDTARDLTGLKESQRVPKFIRNRSSKIKKTIAGGLVGASLGLMGLVYGMTPDRGIKGIEQPSIQRTEYKIKNSLENILEKEEVKE